MTPARLNLDVLRSCSLPRSSPPMSALDYLEDNAESLRLSRREMLGLAGMAAAMAPPGGRALRAGMLGPFTVRADRDRVVFNIGGREAFVVDRRRFGGDPKLDFTRSDQRISLALTGALWPGTRIPADFQCEIFPAVFGWRMRLRMKTGDLRAEVSFERWLAGEEPARGPVSLSATACAPEPGVSLRLSGQAEAEFRPDWTLRLAGGSVGQLSGLGGVVKSDDVRLWLPGKDAPSLLSDHPARRTDISLERGGQSWKLEGLAPVADPEAVRWEREPFDEIRIETGIGAGSRAVCALAAFGRRPESVLWYSPGNESGNGHGPVWLSLARPRYAVAFDRTGRHEALVSDFGEESTWVHTELCSLKVGGGSDGGFEMLREPGGPVIAHCEPPLLELAAPLAGALVQPTSPNGQATVSFASTGTQVAQVRVPGRQPPVVKPQDPQTPAEPPVAQPAPGRPPVVRPQEPVVRPQTPVVVAPPLAIPLDLFIVPVIRPGDLLSLAFQFTNLKLETAGGGQPRLVRRDANKPAYITVHFPPQHVAEEAFLETAPEVDQLPGATQDEQTAPPPVRARLADSSRLVFAVPKDVEAIPYTLESLLDWSKLEPSLSPLAQPPPDPPRRMLPPKRAGTIVVPEVRALQPGDVARRDDLTRPSGKLVVAAPATAAARGVSLDPVSGLRLAPTAELIMPRIPLKPSEPTDLQTAIEAPYRLVMSPNQTAGWVHALREVVRNGRTELWHTRLGVRGEGGTVYDNQYVYGMQDGSLRVLRVDVSGSRNDYYRTLRAIWSPDYSDPMPTHNNVPFRMSLDRRDRCELVWLTGDQTIDGYRSRIVRADRFMLSSLGVWMNVRYGADIPLGTGLSVEEWRHHANMGRDQKVRVVYKGFLFPFGHPASLVKVTERKIERKGSVFVAYLRQRYFIVVREPEQTYPAYGQDKDARGMPFRKIALTTLITPTLDEPQGVLGAGFSAQAAFWPRTGNKDFLFHIKAEDWDGQEAEFTAPMIFVGAEDRVSYRHDTMLAIRNHYNQASNRERRERETFGQNVAFAESSAAKPGDTTLETQAVTFQADLPASGANPDEFEKRNSVRGFPSLAEARVRVPAITQMMGTDQEVTVGIADSYKENGMDGGQNKGEVFLKLKETADLLFPGDMSGGLVSPDLGISGLSRKFGPVAGDIANLAKGVFDPQDFFGQLEAKILGGINLADILKAVFGDATVPSLTVRPIYPESSILSLPEAVEARLNWQPQVQEAGPFKPHSNCKLQLDGWLRTELAGGASSFEMNVSLTRFKVDVVFIIVDFNRLLFKVANGRKPDVDVDIERVDFGGPLEFVNELRKLLSDLGGLSLDIQPSGVSVGFSMAIPNVGVGIMSLENMAMSVNAKLPFTGDPFRLRFAFNSRENPFLLTVSLFGGGGFFALETTTEGVQLMEASFEFGGNFSMNVGVASGGVYLMAGIYFKIEKNTQGGNDVQLTGYVRCGGHLSVLGLITISAEFYLGLTYEVKSGKSRVWGQASLKVNIEILFFSFSVTVSVEREFAGSSSGSAQSLDGARIAGLLDEPGALAQLRGRDRAPERLAPAPVLATRPAKIREVITEQDWKTYCDAFA